MDPLERLLRPVARLVNRQIAQKTPARELRDRLVGRVIGIRVRNTALSIYVSIDEEGLRLSGEHPAEADAVLTGSLLTLAKLVDRSGENAVRDGSLEVTGDAAVAGDVQKLLQYGRPDLEEELSGFVGDAAAHGVGEFARSVGEWYREASETLQLNVREYLQEERRAVPSRAEAEAFRAEVEALRDDVERFEARLKRLERP